MKHENLLIVADSDSHADLRYALGFGSHEPLVFLRIRQQRPILLLPDSELSRSRQLSRRCRLLSLSAYRRRLRDLYRNPITLPQVIRELLREKRLKKVHVPEDFPLGLARDLRVLKVKVKISATPLFPSRQFKTPEEVKKINAALTMAEVGLAEGLLALRNAKASRNRQLTYHNVPLTSEKLRAIMETAVLQAGGSSAHTVVAGGRQTSDPFEPGHGPLRANEPIIIGVFPRSCKTGYHACLTRTVVRGRASDGIRKLYAAVCSAHQLAFSHLSSTTSASRLHHIVQEFLTQHGFPSRCRNSHSEGLTLSIGHGLGLDRLEPPTLAHESNDRLLLGQVFSLSPSLHYPNLGGVRLEDVVQLSTRGPRNLTQFEKLLEL